MRNILISFLTLLLFPTITFGATLPSIKILPSKIIQGEPAMIQIVGAKSAEIKKLLFNGKPLNVFLYKNSPSALLGIDLKSKAGDFPIILELKNGTSTQKTLTVTERQKIEQVMEVPESLGGNSSANQAKVVNTLADENATLANIKTYAKNLWTKAFIYPLSNPIITDEYGYSRQTGAYTLAHKGIDLKAKEGTKIFASNKGIVRVAKKFQIYGNTVVVDHGYGVMTFYLHLSKIKVNVGELVQQGQLIGLSGNTGYVLGPHLHFSVRINNISVDPAKFIDLFK